MTKSCHWLKVFSGILRLFIFFGAIGDDRWSLTKSGQWITRLLNFLALGDNPETGVQNKPEADEESHMNDTQNGTQFKAKKLLRASHQPTR